MTTNELYLVGATSSREVGWHQINWTKAHQTVERLQMRIAKAVREGRWNKAKSLQWLLTHSFYGKAVAVKRVTENRGKKTPGIDHETWDTPEEKANAIKSLNRRGYRPQPLRRVYIPKANGKLRKLGIPTMKDRAMQALHLLALEPIAESTDDHNSYGFRPGRATRDAAEKCFNVFAKKKSPAWVLDADVSGCFDNISHEWMVANIPMDKAILRKWLKAGFVENNQMFATEAGTPQGGIISPTLANMTLDGMQKLLADHFGGQTTRKDRTNKVRLIRYADDFVVSATSKEILEEAKEIIANFLGERGLTLSSEKTKIVHIEEGFDFLGWTIRKYDGKFLIKPSKKNVLAFKRKIREIVKNNKTAKQEDLIRLLNPVIRGWANYHKNQVAKETFSKVDHAIWQQLWRWAKRRHPNKSATWIKRRYFHSRKGRNWVFGTEITQYKGKKGWLELCKASDIPIKRHTKIKDEANPYDPNWMEYFKKRRKLLMKEILTGKGLVKDLWWAQDGLCPVCRTYITDITGWHVHHIIPKSKGGTDDWQNLILTHPNCHYQVHNQNSQDNKVNCRLLSKGAFSEA